jgi:hypothetical protein
MSKKYKINGKGFVPGLPRELTDEEAKELGVEELLAACVKAKLYREVKPKAKKEAD